MVVAVVSVNATGSAENRLMNAPPSVTDSLAGLPLTIASDFNGGATQGAVSGSLDFSYRKVRDILREPANWCAMLLLHQNVKACTYADAAASRAIHLYIGRKEFQSVKQATLMHYEFSVLQDLADSLKIRLYAPRGPLGTRDYEILLRVQPQDQTQTLVSFRYQYQMGTRGRLAMNSYLSTAGREKVGFTVLDAAADSTGAVRYVSGVRGMTERNVVRYFFAIMAYLECAGGAAGCENWPAAAERWFDFTARYPEQLYELSREDYLQNKQRELDQQIRLQALRQ